MKTTPKKSSTLIESLSFEEALSELESIISAMEVGQMPLQETLDIYKRGTILLRHCQETLNAAEQQIHVFEDDTLRPFKPDSLSELNDDK
jgi:exodeoxyribonuclease VII small subunit